MGHVEEVNYELGTDKYACKFIDNNRLVHMILRLKLHSQFLFLKLS